MKQHQTKTNDQSPRYEFRVFAKNLHPQSLLLQQLTSPVPDEFKERESEEIYLITSGNHNLNIKIRGNKLDMKRLINVTEGLEQWEPVMKSEFPLSKKLVQEVFKLLLLPMPESENNLFSLDEFLNMVKKQQDLYTEEVKKERFGYKVNDTICEFARVWINGTRLESVSVESADAKTVQKIITDLAIDSFENTNYIKAIRQVAEENTD